MDIEKLKQKQKDLEKKRKVINAQIKNAEIKDRTNRCISAGKEIAEHFKIDPQCIDASKIAAICSRYFSSELIKNNQVEPEISDIVSDKSVIKREKQHI